MRVPMYLFLSKWSGLVVVTGWVPAVGFGDNGSHILLLVALVLEVLHNKLCCCCSRLSSLFVVIEKIEAAAFVDGRVIEVTVSITKLLFCFRLVTDFVHYPQYNKIARASSPSGFFFLLWIPEKTKTNEFTGYQCIR